MWLLFGTYSQDLGFVVGKGSGVCDDDGNVVIPKSAVTNPSYLTKAGNTIYVVDELKSGGKVLAFDAKTFECVGSAEAAGPDSCYVVATTYHVLVANYAGDGSGGSVACFSKDLKERSVVAVNCAGEYPGAVPSRQESSHAHMVLPLRDESAVLVTDLGSDVVWRIDLSQKEGLRGPASVACRVPSGSGPRHAAFHPHLPLLFVLNELACTVDVFATDDVGCPEKDRLSTYDVGGKDKNQGDTAAALRVTRKALFCSIRVDKGEEGVVCCFQLDHSSGLPTSSVPRRIGSRGQVPRDIALVDDDSKLVVANQNSDNVVVFDLDPTSGLPPVVVVVDEQQQKNDDGAPRTRNESHSGLVLAANTPVCILSM